MKIVISVKDPTPNTINTKLTSKKSNEALGHLTFDIFFFKKKIIHTFDISSCEGCFCDFATLRAEGDHYVDLSF